MFLVGGGVPMGPLMAAIADEQNLASAWETVRKKDLHEGVNSRSVEKFARKASSAIVDISAQLINGTWKPLPLHRVTLKKRTGGYRQLGVPPIRDRIVERAIMQTITPLIDPWFSPWAFAYRPGLGVADALRALVNARNNGAKWVLKIDFQDCFDHLRHDLLLHELAQYISADNKDVVDLVESLLLRPIWAKSGLINNTVGAPQGGPLSAMLSNLLLSRFDNALVGYGWPAIRYADDVVVPTFTRQQAEEILEVSRVEAGLISMKLTEGKAQIVAFQEGFVFLGEDVNHKYPEDLPIELRPVADRRTLYVGRQGAMVRLNKGRIRVTDREQEIVSIPASFVGQIVTFGSVIISPAVIANASAKGWSVIYMSRRGWLHGWFEGPQLARVSLRRKQYRLGEDPEFRLALARQMVLGKIANQRALLARYSRRNTVPRVVGAINQLHAVREDIQEAESIETLLGLEGSSARTYFEALAELVPEWARFSGRTRNPPTDPTNAVLSYLYTVLSGQMISAILTAGLDPTAGFLHTDQGRRPSLALDLMEEFRPLLVDTLVLTLLRRGTLNPDQFETDERDHSVNMKPTAKKNVINSFEERMLTVFAHTPSRQKVSYRRALFLQAQQVATCIRNGEVDYRAVSWR